MHQRMWASKGCAGMALLPAVYFLYCVYMNTLYGNRTPVCKAKFNGVHRCTGSFVTKQDGIVVTQHGLGFLHPGEGEKMGQLPAYLRTLTLTCPGLNDDLDKSSPPPSYSPARFHQNNHQILH